MGISYYSTSRKNAGSPPSALVRKHAAPRQVHIAIYQVTKIEILLITDLVAHMLSYASAYLDRLHKICLTFISLPLFKPKPLDQPCRWHLILPFREACRATLRMGLQACGFRV